MSLDPRWLLEVARRPEDDDWRRVFADRIAEDDPELATFIQLQLYAGERALTPVELARMVEIREKRRRGWLEPVASGLRDGHYAFARGFLDAVNIYADGRRHARELARSPIWSTVTQVSARRHLPLMLRGGQFLSLRTLGTAFLRGPEDSRVAPSWGAAIQCDALSGFRLPEGLVGLQVDLSTDAHVRAFYNHFGRTNLVGIREVGIVCRGRISRDVLEEFPAELERLSLAVPAEEIDTWVGLARRLFPRLRVIDLAVGGSVTALRRDGETGGVPPVQPATDRARDGAYG